MTKKKPKRKYEFKEAAREGFKVYQEQQEENKTLIDNNYKQKYRHLNNCLNNSFYIGNIDAIIDDIKIYKGAMTSNQISIDYDFNWF